ncbi:MAG: hypothetical protein ACO3JL_09265 [Myxococcota bacterium]
MPIRPQITYAVVDTEQRIPYFFVRRPPMLALDVGEGALCDPTK